MPSGPRPWILDPRALPEKAEGEARRRYADDPVDSEGRKRARQPLDVPTWDSRRHFHTGGDTFLGGALTRPCVDESTHTQSTCTHTQAQTQLMGQTPTREPSRRCSGTPLRPSVFAGTGRCPRPD